MCATVSWGAHESYMHPIFVLCQLMCATVSWGAHESYMHPIFVLKNGCDMYPLAFRKLAHYISSFNLTSHGIQSCMSPFISLLASSLY
jgi:hypothetical protein